jgi:hypothetical protein
MSVMRCDEALSKSGQRLWTIAQPLYKLLAKCFNLFAVGVAMRNDCDLIAAHHVYRRLSRFQTPQCHPHANVRFVGDTQLIQKSAKGIL